MNTLQDFINEWTVHRMKIRGRDNLEQSDKCWNSIFDLIGTDDKYDSLHFNNELLFRVHRGGQPKPELSDFDDHGEYQNKVYEQRLEEWKTDNDPTCIRWDNFWVSFTENPEIIDSSYYSQKGLRGFVIVIKPEKAIKIHNFVQIPFNEYEVVAPMDKETLIEILPFEQFKTKYLKNLK